MNESYNEKQQHWGHSGSLEYIWQMSYMLLNADIDLSNGKGMNKTYLFGLC